MSSAGPIDEDTARAINSGRETLGVFLRTLQTRLQKVFIAFVIGLLAGIIAMRSYIWPQLKTDLLARGASVIAQTPFDVILLQVKIGLAIGIITALPMLGYYMKQPLADRGLVPDVRVKRWKLAVIGVFALLLSVFGVVYAYFLFFPIMFTFLAGNALGAGLAPLYSIVHWTEFILILALSFALAANLPLAMTALSYAEIVPYETFRDKWKYAVVAIFSFGALFSPPDPFTQMMWAFPLLALYGFSLYLARIVTTAKRGSRSMDLLGILRARWNRVAGIGVLGGALAYAFFGAGGSELLNTAVLARLPATIRPAPVPPIEAIVGMPRGSAIWVSVGVVTIAVAFLAALVILYRAIEAAQAGARADPYIDEFGLDLAKVQGAAGVKAAPSAVFEKMGEEDAVAAARQAMADEDPDKAQAILDRWDEVSEATQAAEVEAESAEAAAEEPAEESDTLTRTTAGMVNAFTEDETTEDDIGGYYYDIAFIFDSLRSRAFRLTAIFMLVMAGTFAFLYQGGIGIIRADFLSRIPPEVRPDPAATPWPITLHPVEALVFEVKISVVIAAVVILPFLFYYAWPALEARGLITGDRNTVYLWGISIIVGILIGSILGYLYVAPPIISYLVQDAIRAGITISYRVNNFFWMVFLTTAGIGLLADIPVTMWLFHRGGIVTYHTMRRRWRVAVMGFFVFGALVTPDSLYTMLLIAIPMALAYLFGLAVLWVVTLGGRRGGKPSQDSRDPDDHPVLS